MPAVEGDLALKAALAALAGLEGALRDSEAERFALFETSTCGRAYADPFSGRLLHANRKLRDLTGYTEEELLEKAWWEFIVQEDRDRHRDDLERLARGFVPEISFEASCLRKNGQSFPARIWVVTVRSETWRPIRTVVSIGEK